MESNGARGKYIEINVVKISVAHSQIGYMQGPFVRETKQKITAICAYLTLRMFDPTRSSRTLSPSSVTRISQGSHPALATESRS